MMDLLLIAFIGFGSIGLMCAYILQMIRLDNEILMWKNAYAELALELELKNLGVMK